MLNSLQDTLLILYVIHVLTLDNFRLLHRLNRILVLRFVFQPANLYIAEGPFTKTLAKDHLLYFTLIEDSCGFSHGRQSLVCTCFYHNSQKL